MKNPWRIYQLHLRRYLPWLWPLRGKLLLVFFLLLGITLANAIMLWLMGIPVTYLAQGRYTDLVTILGILALVLLLKFSFHFCYDGLVNDVGLRLITRIRSELLQHLMRLSFPGVAAFQKGDVLARLSNDIDQIQVLSLKLPLLVLSHSQILLVYLLVLFYIDWRLSLIALCVAPVFYFHQRLIAPVKGRVADQFFKANGGLLGFEEQVVANLRGISSFNAEGLIRDRHGAVINEARRWVLRNRIVDSFYNWSFAALTFFSGILVVFFGVEAIRAGRIEIGELISFMLYLGYLAIPLQGIAEIPVLVKGAKMALIRVEELFLIRPLIEGVGLTSAELAAPLSPDKLLPAEQWRGEIDVQDLVFSYPTAQPIFNGINCRVNAGETVALVGPSGSGKSTFARLLLRFYDPNRGCIKLDGIDLRELPLSQVRAAFAVVWQEPFIIDASVADNLRLANARADDTALIQACRDSMSWEFVSQLEQGLQTRIGAGGVELSTGQKQRLSISQAFLRNAPVLILDEASSALDSQSEQCIVESLHRLCKNRTTLIIAHRFSSIRRADRILFFNGDGSLTEGQHDELFVSHAPYREAVKWQTDYSNSSS